MAIRERAPAGQVLDSSFNDDPNDSELRIAFDFDGVLADDSAEQVYKSEGLVGFQTLEQSNSSRPHQKGPLHGLIMKLAKLQQLELKHKTRHPSYEPTLRTAIITARNAPAHKRFVTTLRDWGLNVNETFFLGGIDKNRILEVLRPHIFFDDQLTHVRPAAGVVPAVHVPFGVANSKVAAAKNVKTKRS